MGKSAPGLHEECVKRRIMPDRSSGFTKARMSAMLSCYECNLYESGGDRKLEIDFMFVKRAEELWHSDKKKHDVQKEARDMGVDDSRTVCDIIARILRKMEDNKGVVESGKI